MVCGSNPSSIIKNALCRRCGKSFEAHDKKEADNKDRLKGTLALSASADAATSADSKDYVVLTTAHIRVSPNVKSRSLGTVSEGHSLSGSSRNGWLLLSQDSMTMALGKSSPREAWRRGEREHFIHESLDEGWDGRSLIDNTYLDSRPGS